MSDDTNKTKIDTSKVPTPKIEFTPLALSQLELMLENDFTLSGKYLRLLISGKGCDGFNYSIGFTDLEENDLLIPINNELSIIIDPFTAFYLQESTVDYIQDFERDQEGFKVVNHHQTKYHGKFWKKNEDRVPPTLVGGH